MLQVAVERGLAQQVSAFRLARQQRLKLPLLRSALVALRLYSKGHKLARAAEALASRQLLSKALRRWMAAKVRIRQQSSFATYKLGVHSHGSACCVAPKSWMSLL